MEHQPHLPVQISFIAVLISVNERVHHFLLIANICFNFIQNMHLYIIHPSAFAPLRCRCNPSSSYISSAEELGGASAPASPPHLEYTTTASNADLDYTIAGSNSRQSNEPLRERFDLLMQVVSLIAVTAPENVYKPNPDIIISQVVAPFAALPLTKDNIKAVKTAFIMKNSELAKYTRFSLPSTDEIRRALGVVRVGQHQSSFM
jgi:hypothetical protein